jgi:hypothetical protein
MLRRGDGELKDSRAATRAAGRERARCDGRGVVELASLNVWAESYIYIDVRSPRRCRRPMIFVGC